MADQGVNPQITDAITQTNVKVLGEAPAQAMGLVYQTLAHSISLSMNSAQATQAGMQQIGTAIVSTAVTKILGMIK